MSDTTIDDILMHLTGQARIGRVPEAKSALYDLILKEVVGEDRPLYPKDGGMVEAEYIVRDYQNTLRATQRKKLKELFDDNLQ